MATTFWVVYLFYNYFGCFIHYTTKLVVHCDYNLYYAKEYVCAFGRCHQLKSDKKQEAI